MGFNIAKYVFLLLSLGLFGFLSRSIYMADKEASFIEDTEEAVIERLINIRELEEAFKSVHGRYTADWDSLKVFAKTGAFPIIERQEKIIVREFGGDSIYVKLDTLGMVPVRDSLYSSEKEWEKLNIEEINKVPVTGKKFTIKAGKIRYGKISVIEVKDPEPVNPERTGDGPLSPLKFGSMNEATTAGNWEK